MKEHANAKPARRRSPAKDPPLPEALVERIGTASDAALAREFGVPQLRILRFRKRNGIPGSRKLIAWTPEMDALVRGDLPTAECAVLLGVDRMAVYNRRLALGVPIPPPSEQPLPPHAGSRPWSGTGRRAGIERCPAEPPREKLSPEPRRLPSLPDRLVSAPMEDETEAISGLAALGARAVLARNRLAASQNPSPATSPYRIGNPPPILVPRP